MTVFVGDDWGEEYHEIHVMDEGGVCLVRVRLLEGLEGIGRFHEILAGLVDDPSEVVIATETDRGLWVTALVAADYRVYAINPMVVSRYRDRHHIAGAKSDPGDAKVLADLVRTDCHLYRPIAGDTPDVAALKVLARGHQTLIWERTRQGLRLRSALREYYPAALVAFGDDLTGRDAVAILEKAPHPREGARLTLGQIKAALRKAGRRRYLDQKTERIQKGLRSSQLSALDPVADAFAVTTRSGVAIISELNRQIADIEKTLGEQFRQHPDADIYLSLPGAGEVLGARSLSEFGDDPDRYATAKSRKNYAGTPPITRESGKSRVVVARHIRNRRLYDAIDQIALHSRKTSPGCRAYYNERRDKGDTHPQALRALGNRLVGILHGCLKTRTLYNEDTAWGHRQPTQQPAAA